MMYTKFTLANCTKGAPPHRGVISAANRGRGKPQKFAKNKRPLINKQTQ